MSSIIDIRSIHNTISANNLTFVVSNRLVHVWHLPRMFDICCIA